MLIAHVFFQTSSDDRPKALAVLLGEAPQVRAMPGCVRFQPFVDPADDAGVGILHEWESAQAFAAYAGSPMLAAAREALVPLMTSKPVSKRFEARLVDTVR